MKKLADGLAEDEYNELIRRAERVLSRKPRQRPENVKERIVREREFRNIRLNSEDIAEFGYQPTACKQTYRVVVVRKNLTIEKGQEALFDDFRYFFYITNDKKKPRKRLSMRPVSVATKKI